MGLQYNSSDAMYGLNSYSSDTMVFDRVDTALEQTESGTWFQY